MWVILTMLNRNSFLTLNPDSYRGLTYYGFFMFLNLLEMKT